MSAFGAFCAFVGIPIPVTRVIVDCKSGKKTYDVPPNGQSS